MAVAPVDAVHDVIEEVLLRPSLTPIFPSVLLVLLLIVATVVVDIVVVLALSLFSSSSSSSRRYGNPM